MAIITTSTSSQHVGRRIVDVLNNEFGCSYGSYQHGYWVPDNSAYVVWFPKVSLSRKGRGDADWQDLFTDVNKNELTVVWNGAPNEFVGRESHAATYADRLQIVFANIEGESGYEFVGVYKLVNRDANGVRHYERVATSIDTSLCPPRL